MITYMWEYFFLHIEIYNFYCQYRLVLEMVFGINYLPKAKYYYSILFYNIFLPTININ